MKSGLLSFHYREIDELIKNGIKITIFPTKYHPGVYMPNERMHIYRYSPNNAILKQPFFLIQNPLNYLKLLAFAIKTGSLLDFLIGCDFANQMKERKINKIYCGFGDHKLFIGYYCKKLLNLPLLVTIHAHELYTNPNWDMFQRSLNACDLIITISEWNKEILVNKFKIPEKKILVNRLFVDTEMFTPNKSIKILIVSSFDERKGHDVLFKAVERLSRDDIKIWVVGSDEAIPVAEKSLPKDLAKELQIDDKTIFFGKVSEEILRTLYESCDIFVLPSKTSKFGQLEGIPVALMEAMSCGKPVISTRHSGIPELVEEILVEENNVEELTKAIELLSDNPDLRKKLGERNRKIIDERYSKNNVLKLLDIFLKR